MSLNQQISQLIQKTVKELFKIEKVIKLEVPKDTKFGDFACNIAMQIVKEVSKNPREIAQEIIENLPENELIEKVEIAGPGFLNITVKPEIIVEIFSNINEKYGNSEELKGKKIMVEFAHPNTHKAFHIGHLRNICLGESLVRIIDSQGTELCRANYQGDVGLHVAKCLWAIIKKEKINQHDETLNEAIKKLKFSKSLSVKEKEQCLDTIKQKLPFLYKSISDTKKSEYFGKFYAKGGQAYEKNEKAKQEIHQINKNIYECVESKNLHITLKFLWDKTREWSLNYFEHIYKRLGTQQFDHYYFESQTFELGKETVLKFLEKGVFEESEKAIIFDGEKYGLHKRVFITHEGNPTYEGKDMGLFQMQYKDFPFDRNIHVVASEQAEYFKVIFEAMDKIQPGMKEKQYNLSYGMVKLTSGKMSSRTGDVITAEWLIDEAKQKVAEVLKESDLSDEEKEEINEKVALGAIKFTMLHATARNDIAFDLEQAVKLHGDSGPYLQYAYTRISSILRNFDCHPESSSCHSERSLRSEESLPPTAKDSSVATLPQNDISFETFNESDWNLAKKLIYFPEVVTKCADEYSPHHITRYLLDLAALFSSWYEQNSVKNAEPELQKVRLKLLQSVRQVLKNGLYLLGIETVEKM